MPLYKTILYRASQNSEIACFLAVCHGIAISLSHLKRLLRRFGLRRRPLGGNESPMEEIVKAVHEEISGSGSMIGYRAMWNRLRKDHDLLVCRDTVRILMLELDPEGVNDRRRKRMRRRNYTNRGPNGI